MAAIMRSAVVLQNCLKSVPLRQAINRTPCIIATSIQHHLKQQNSRQYKTLTEKYKVGPACDLHTTVYDRRLV